MIEAYKSQFPALRNKMIPSEPMLQAFQEEWDILKRVVRGL